MAGFSAILTTLDGKPAQTCGHGAIADYIADDATPNQHLITEFMYLPHNTFIGWNTSIYCAPTHPGRYVVEASYEPNNPHTSQVATLSSTEGHVITNRAEAQPVEIEIQ